MKRNYLYIDFHKKSLFPSNTNTTLRTKGRFCNHFIRNMAAHFISKKNNLNFTYSYKKEIEDLGIILFNGKKTYKNIVNITDKNLIEHIKHEKKDYNINCFDYYQIPEFSLLLRDCIHENKQQIIDKNKNKERYNANNDLYIHVRLGDVKKFNPGFNYYDDIIKNINFDKAFISSDSIHYPICKKLIEKYNINVLDINEVDTIKFASTCKYIILSNGTFSWMIGVFAFFSDIYYPIMKKKWNGDIFVFEDWKGITVK
jgi:hypothetical protein